MCSIILLTRTISVVCIWYRIQFVNWFGRIVIKRDNIYCNVSCFVWKWEGNRKCRKYNSSHLVKDKHMIFLKLLVLKHLP